MLFLFAYWVFMLLTLGLSWRIGNSEIRLAIFGCILASFATVIAGQIADNPFPAATILIIDVALLVFVISIGLRSNQFWPLWFSGFQAAGVLIIISSFIFPEENQKVFQTLATFWAIPALIALLIGAYLDRLKAFD